MAGTCLAGKLEAVEAVHLPDDDRMQAAIAKMLADGVVILHAAVLAIYFAGAVSVLRGRFSGGRLLFWHRGYLVIVLAMAMTTAYADKCPLTRLENALRAAGDPTTCYSTSYVECYVPWMPPIIDQVISLILLAIGGIGAFLAFLTWVRSQELLTGRRTD
jgi:hypothetical protein